MYNNIIHVQLVFDDGGLGDCIARTTVVNFILKYHSNVILHWFIPDFFLPIAENLYKNNKKVIIKTFTQVNEKPSLYNSKGATYAFRKHATRMNNLSTHMVDHAFFLMNFQPIKQEDKNYPQLHLENISIDKFNLPEKYAVMAVGYTSEVREFLPKHVNAVTDFLLSNGITPIFVGRSESANGVGHVIAPTFKEEIDYSKGINLIDKTNLLETAKICQNATMVIGLDNGCLHLAACTGNVPIVYGFTTVAKEHRMPYRNGVLGFKVEPVELTKTELNCIGCQSFQNFLFNHRFTTCYTKTKKCLDLLSADKYIEAIKKIVALLP